MEALIVTVRKQPSGPWDARLPRRLIRPGAAAKITPPAVCSGGLQHITLRSICHGRDEAPSQQGPM